jgi:hypothetical protein
MERRYFTLGVLLVTACLIAGGTRVSDGSKYEQITIMKKLPKGDIYTIQISIPNDFKDGFSRISTSCGCAQPVSWLKDEETPSKQVLG